MSVVSLQNISKTYDTHTVLNNLSLDVVKGEFLTLLGPSGCGKTTVLRLIAGLETCTRGEIYIDGCDHTHVPACDRDVNTVFQSYALFPHMTVFDNIAFGLKLKKVPFLEIKTRVEETLALVKLSGLGNRRIQNLSGGQQQRVAIARAIVNEPLILLLDEPLSALDYKLRKEMRLELRQLHRKLGITFIFVTHDQEEALILSDRVVVMNNGVIEQQGPPKDIYEEPVNRFVAEFVGESNLFDARVVAAREETMDIEVQGIVKTVRNRKNHGKDDGIMVLLRPEDMIVERGEAICPDGFFPGRVEEMIYKGTTVDLIIVLDGGKKVFVLEFFNEDAETIFYDVGEKVFVSWIDGWEVVLAHE
ncbi:PotA2 [Desulforapulum autotrophicum HRM2]|uniref:Spermidine/putrescine import ATP-binding protein PotA n=1 Tax=Desulforapulum autotrophicum (strain ATCC 43914 / DSM 3382 / VKM B-1955 / HRM2) TaxID=177437 RepID=C0Q8Z3_DESAH|nr:spermidine/putrescine ABC transporter ATP-binding protein PotA [Desulforapulum autotrophicum]ACN14483.1 PotA2 [Desulforapulum autotrophicum HRM2]